MGVCCTSSKASLLLRDDSSSVVSWEASQAIRVCSDGISDCLGVEEPGVEGEVVDIIAILHSYIRAINDRLSNGLRLASTHLVVALIVGLSHDTPKSSCIRFCLDFLSASE